MSFIVVRCFIFAFLFKLLDGVNPPVGCRFLNLVHDSLAEEALLKYFNNSESLVFSETSFFQPQCLLCESAGVELCFGYKFGAAHGITSGTIDTVRTITNLPYLYSIADPVGNQHTTITALFVLRENITIPNRVLSRFKGIKTLDPVVSTKSIVLRLGAICLAGDQKTYGLEIEGDVYNLAIRLFVNRIEVNATNGILLRGNSRTTVNCATQRVITESLIYPSEDVPCDSQSCLGSEFCLTFQPEYAGTRETWCPLTKNNWVSTVQNALQLRASDAILPLHIYLDRELVTERSFSFNFNPNWFIDYQGILTIVIPEVTPDQNRDPVWRIALASMGKRPSNQRLILLYNCRDVRIQFEAADRQYLEATTTFIDMKSNMTFSVINRLEDAKRLCNEEILVAVGDQSSTSSEKPVPTTNPWHYTGLSSTLRVSFVSLLSFTVILIFLY